jgi:pantetheine-phosphate adenylyltransferase
MSLAVCPGSYDPVTYGHMDVIRRAAAIYDELIVAVVNASVRKTKPLFDIEERLGFVEETVQAEGLDNVRAEPFDVLIVEFAREKGATAIIKGLRAISDFEYELEMASLNRLQAPDIESVYLMASPEYSFLRSSGVKDLATFGGDVTKLVPPQVALRLQEELMRQRTTR